MWLVVPQNFVLLLNPNDLNYSLLKKLCVSFQRNLQTKRKRNFRMLTLNCLAFACNGRSNKMPLGTSKRKEKVKKVRKLNFILIACKSLNVAKLNLGRFECNVICTWSYVNQIKVG